MRINKLLFLALLIPSIALAEMPKEDTVKGVKDHPLLSRFTGAKLVAYSMKEFDEVELVAGKKVENKEAFEKMQKVEGKFTRIKYCYPADRSSLEVMRNYQAALTKAGLSTIFACEKASCGNGFGDVMGNHIDAKGFSGEGDSDYWGAPFNYGRLEPRYLLASGKRTDGSIAYASVYVTPPTSGKLGGIYLEIVEPKAMENDKVTVNLNAGDLAKGLAADGKIALYGIYFDSNKADVKSESKPQLAEMAKLLQQDATLKVYIVGHTDNQGAMARNLPLSQQRAEAVVKALVTDYKIAATRLSAKGIASYSPVATNDNDVGKAKNRRVELVKF